MQCTEMLTRVTANWDGEGNPPPIVHVIVRFILAVMWLYRGDLAPWERLRRQWWSRGCQGWREGSVALLSKRKSITQDYSQSSIFPWAACKRSATSLAKIRPALLTGLSATCPKRD